MGKVSKLFEKSQSIWTNFCRKAKEQEKLFARQRERMNKIEAPLMRVMNESEKTEACDITLACLSAKMTKILTTMLLKHWTIISRK